MIGIGVDLCEVDRMRMALDRTPSLRARVFTDEEQAYCDQRRDPTERYAARFAAKEAVAKALGTGIGVVAWTEIEIIRGPQRQPELRLHGTAARLAAELGLSEWAVSLSHTHQHAVAFAVAATAAPGADG